MRIRIGSRKVTRCIDHAAAGIISSSWLSLQIVRCIPLRSARRICTCTSSSLSSCKFSSQSCSPPTPPSTSARAGDGEREAELLTERPCTSSRNNRRLARAPGRYSRRAAASAAAEPADGASLRSSRDGGGEANSTTLSWSLIGHPKFGCHVLRGRFV